MYIYIYVHNCVVENIENLRTTQENRHPTSQQECSRTDNALSKASPMHALIVQDCVHCLCLLCNWKSCYVCKDWDTTLAMRANCNCFVEREAVWKKTVGVNPQQSLVWHHLWQCRNGQLLFSLELEFQNATSKCWSGQLISNVLNPYLIQRRWVRPSKGKTW